MSLRDWSKEDAWLAKVSQVLADYEEHEREEIEERYRP